jgi:FkbM family methyltransferase
LQSTGFKPATIVDVGVATDTEELYFRFGDSKFIFVEPLEEFKPNLEQLITRYNGNYILGAAGSYDGEIEISVTADLGGTSMYKHKDSNNEQLQKELGIPLTVPRKVPIFKLDTIWEALEGQGPAILKVDVQGGELEVLRGAESCLENFEIVIVEVGLVATYEGQPLFDDFINFMYTRGFKVIDFINAGYANNGILLETDVVFAKKDGWLSNNNQDSIDYSTAKHWNNYKGVRRNN